MIEYSSEQGIATITLNRPEKLNALDADGYSDLASAIRRFSSDTETRALILTGAGRAFCAGQDLGDADRVRALPEQQAQQEIETIQAITTALMGCSKPTLAALNGPAVGAGAEIPLGCDLRFAGRSAFLQFPEMSRGFFNTNGSTALLPRLLGSGRATELLLLGERIQADEALATGLVNRVFDDDELMAQSMALAQRLAEIPVVALSRLKQALRDHPGWPMPRVLEAETEAVMQLMSAGRSGDA